MLRSKGAEPETPTFVELVFSYGDKGYTIMRNSDGYMRAKSRGGGMTEAKSKVELHLPNGRVITKERDVKAEIEDIMGITAVSLRRLQ